MWRCYLCPFSSCYSFIATFFLTLLHTCKEDWHSTPSPGRWEEEAAAGQSRWEARARQTPAQRVLRVKAGNWFHPWVGEPGRLARHCAEKLGQTGKEWEQKEEWAWNESSGRRWSCSARGPFLWQLTLRLVGGLVSLKPQGQSRQTTPLYYCACSLLILDFDHIKRSAVVYLFPDSAQRESCGSFSLINGMHQILLA